VCADVFCFVPIGHYPQPDGKVLIGEEFQTVNSNQLFPLAKP
jgi:hypothetical protein